MRARNFWIALALASAIFIVALYARPPRGEGPWMEHLSRTSTAWRDASNLVHITNVRDWTYAEKAILTKDWLDEVRVDPEGLTRVWFMLEPFPDWSAVGHTYLSFEFKDGMVLSFSVEARIEEGKKYSAWKGLLPTYELLYTWGTERDFLARRLLFLTHTVRMYPLAIDHNAAKNLFSALVEETNTAANHPRFYNTLTANCTNILAETVNEHYPGTIPYDISWNFPGSSDTFLMKQKFITTESTVEETKQQNDLGRYRADIEGFATDDALTFSHKLRMLYSPE